MKQLMMTMGLCLMAATVMGQKEVGLSTLAGGQQGGVHREKAIMIEVYGEVTASRQSNSMVVRFKVDESYKMLTRDENFATSVKMATAFRFGSVLEAMTSLASHGWELRTTHVSRERVGDVTHYIMARSIQCDRPYSPWLDREKNSIRKK